MLTKEGDTIKLLAGPEENVRLGESILIDKIVVQVVETQFADVPCS